MPGYNPHTPIFRAKRPATSDPGHSANAHYVNGWSLTVQGQAPTEVEIRRDRYLVGAAARELRSGRGDARSWLAGDGLSPRAKKLKLHETDFAREAFARARATRH